MRLFAFLLLTLASSCHDAPQIDEIHIRMSGWSAVDVALTADGKGHFEISGVADNKSGSFHYTPQQFRALRDRLEPFHRQSVQFSDDSLREFIEGGRCQEGVPFVTDRGAIYIRWTGPGIDQHYLADLGCDFERNAARNTELRNIVEGFPLPLNW